MVAMFRRLLSLLVITLTLNAAVDSQEPAGGTKVPPLRSSDLAGLRLRGIGPATMSGRFVDMDVVESNPVHHVCRLGDGRHVSHHRQRHHVGAGVRARSGALDRRRRDLSARSQHHLGRHRRARQSAERELGRRRLQDHRRRQDVDQRRPQDLDAHRPHRHSPIESRRSSTWPRRDRCGDPAANAGSIARWTAARRGSARCTWTTTPASPTWRWIRSIRTCSMPRRISAAEPRSASTAAVPAARSGRAPTPAPRGRS